MTKITIDRAVVEQAVEACPFCGNEPSFSGNASEWKDESRYVELSLGCCVSMTEQIGWRRARDMTHEAKTAELRSRLRSKWNTRAALAEPQEPVQELPWLRAIDEAMIDHHVGVADPADDYETAKRKLNNLLCHAQDIGAHFAKQAEPVQEPVCWYDPTDFTRTTNRQTEKEYAPLYAAPLQRKPLTDAQADQIISGLQTCHHQSSKREFLKVWLRDWAAHGIKEEK
jgi:hypothetical protein